MKKLSHKLLIAAAAVALSNSVLADEGADLYTAKVCHTCHGADGNTPTMPAYPKIAGQSEEYLVQQLNDFKSGARSNGQSATMKAMLMSVSEDEIKKISKYLSGL